MNNFQSLAGICKGLDLESVQRHSVDFTHSVELDDVTQLDAIDVTHTFEIDDVLQIVAIDVKEPAEKFKKVGFPRASARSASSSSR